VARSSKSALFQSNGKSVWRRGASISSQGNTPPSFFSTQIQIEDPTDANRRTMAQDASSL
jgi:hypothetical protein